MTRQKGQQRQRLFANYWETDTTMNPQIVQVINYNPKRNHQIVQLPNGGGRRQVHIHELGAPHAAW